MIAGLEPTIQQSFQIKLQEMVRPKPVSKPKPVKKVIKKARKKAIKPVEKQEVVEQPQEKVTPTAPPTKPFESSIQNYVNPHYPRLALRRGITGTVRLTLWVKGSGQIDKVILAQSSGHASLDNSALSAAKQWTFKQLSPKEDDIYRLSTTIVYKIN